MVSQGTLLRALTVLIALIAFPSVPAAAEMKSVKSYFDQPSDQIEPSYILVRCAGLNASMLAYIGEERMGRNMYTTTKNNGDLLMKVAAYMREEKSGPGGSDGIVRDVANIANIYTERMNKNYAKIGKAFGEDKLILSDLSTCKLVVENFR